MFLQTLPCQINLFPSHSYSLEVTRMFAQFDLHHVDNTVIKEGFKATMCRVRKCLMLVVTVIVVDCGGPSNKTQYTTLSQHTVPYFGC